MAKPNKETVSEAPVSASEAPVTTFKAFSIIRAPGGWSHLTIDISIDGNGSPTVTNIEASQPDVKAVAIEKLKISNFKYWTSL